MPITVTVDRREYADGVPFEILGIGIIKNRESLELSEDQERDYAGRNLLTVQNGLTETPDVQVSGSPILTGSLEEILGYKLSDVNDQPPQGEATGDLSPATSMGESWEDRTITPEEAPPAATEVTNVTPFAGVDPTTVKEDPLAPTEEGG